MVTAMVFLSVVMVGSLGLALLTTQVVSNATHPAVAAIVSAMAAAALLITAVGFNQMHWNDSCHHAGGVLGKESHECLKPNSWLHVK